jgi:hypothetical protein
MHHKTRFKLRLSDYEQPLIVISHLSNRIFYRLIARNITEVHSSTELRLHKHPSRLVTQCNSFRIGAVKMASQ